MELLVYRILYQLMSMTFSHFMLLKSLLNLIDLPTFDDLHSISFIVL